MPERECKKFICRKGGSKGATEQTDYSLSTLLFILIKKSIVQYVVSIVDMSML